MGKETSSQDFDDNLICHNITTSLRKCAVQVLGNAIFPWMSWLLDVMKV